jgi:hypothetical protein
MFDDFGDFKLNVQCVHPEERIHVALWELRRLWEQGDIGE